MRELLNNLSTLLQSLELYTWWQIAVQWLIIGAVIYWVMRFLRGTRGARLLRGIVLLLVGLTVTVRLATNTLKLPALGWLFDQFFGFASFAIIVVFQPELRRALMRLGETRLLRGWSSEVHEEIGEVVEAAAWCSKRKIGALIAIERDVGLGGIAENGTRINADITAELLETIFFPNTPLHDLGVVISQGKVAYAGVQFPLAEEGTLERELGSRHRAAVGMSAESDAVIIVVSEQTGDISIAERGVLLRKLTPDTLRGMLGELLGIAQKKRLIYGRRRELPCADLQRAAVIRGWVGSLLSWRSVVDGSKTLAWLTPVTLAVWFYGERQQFEPRQQIQIPIAIRSSSPGTTYVNLQMDNNVMVDLKGPANQLDGLIKMVQSEPITEVELNIPDNLNANDINYEPAVPLLSASAVFKKYPAIEITRCTPDRIKVYVDKYEERSFEVRAKNPEALDKPAVFSPSHVSVKAPKHSFPPEMDLHPENVFIVADLAVVRAAGNALEREGMANVSLPGLIDVRPSSVTYSPQLVDAQFALKPANASFYYPSIPVCVVAPPNVLSQISVECEPTFPGVTVVGPPDKIAALKDSPSPPKPRVLVELSVADLTRKGTGSYQQAIRFDQLPDPLIQVSPKDESRTVTVTINPSGTQ